MAARTQTFHDWAHTVSCTAEAYFEPQTEDEIREIVLSARAKGKTLKVVGNCHSLNALPLSTDYMMSLKRYSKILEIDKTNARIKVQGGVSMKHLMEITLPDNGLAFSVLPSVRDVTAAGIMCTGSHGSGYDHGTVSCYVTAVDIMTATGEVIEVSEQTNAELLPAARQSLGSLGIILTVTFQCEPAFNLHFKQSPSTLDEVLDKLDERVKLSEHFSFGWFPYTEGVVCFDINRTNEEPAVAFSWFWQVFVGYYVFHTLHYISTFIPMIVPYINRLFYNVQSGRIEAVARSDQIFCMDLENQIVTEWAIPLNTAAAAVRRLKSWIEKTGFPACCPVICRFVKADNVYLSPAYGSGIVCYIQALMWRKRSVHGRCNDYRRYFSAFDTMMLESGGRPHWAKPHSCSARDLRSLYPMWKTFQEIRQRLDPSGLFMNAELVNLFGDDK